MIFHFVNISDEEAGKAIIDALNKIKATKKSDWLEVTIDCETETINIPSMV